VGLKEVERLQKCLMVCLEELDGRREVAMRSASGRGGEEVDDWYSWYMWNKVVHVTLLLRKHVQHLRSLQPGGQQLHPSKAATNLIEELVASALGQGEQGQTHRGRGQEQVPYPRERQGQGQKQGHGQRRMDQGGKGVQWSGGEGRASFCPAHNANPNTNPLDNDSDWGGWGARARASGLDGTSSLLTVEALQSRFPPCFPAEGWLEELSKEEGQLMTKPDRNPHPNPNSNRHAGLHPRPCSYSRRGPRSGAGPPLSGSFLKGAADFSKVVRVTSLFSAETDVAALTLPPLARALATACHVAQGQG
ncbi:unnamed protein product, partial [Discosporangium mesarthrocarpum]